MRREITLMSWLILAVTLPVAAQETEENRANEKTPPAGVVFLGDDCSLYRPAARTGTAADSLTVTVFTVRRSRAFPEHDLPGPVKAGHKLYKLVPASSKAQAEVLWDAGKGAIGSPTVSYDGQYVLFCMAREGDSFFHIYRIPVSGGRPQQLTNGPFHDIDPVELPDGRIAFVSTRIGKFDEYHSAPARSLFVMDSNGKTIRPLTHTIIFDNEPEVLADGRILFIRSDNFFDRGKVETRLHVVHPDGTRGETAFGIDRSPGYGARLRAFYCGSPAPLPDGRVAFVSAPGITIGVPGTSEREWQHLRLSAGDVAAMPDGRLLCTIGTPRPTAGTVGNKPPQDGAIEYRQLAVIDPDAKSAAPIVFFRSTESEIHSPVFLGPRVKPPVLPSTVADEATDDTRATGFLFCQDARFTRNTTAGWPHIRAVRVLAAKAITNRSSHSYIVHAGSEVVELGTVPLAPDGSFHIEVPADTPLALQLVDAEGRSELNEMSWIYVRPGERRSCVGCHESPRSAPLRSGHTALALEVPPLRLSDDGEPHRFRGNNAAVTGLMELQFDRFREVAGLNRHEGPGEQEMRPESPRSASGDIGRLLDQLEHGDRGERISAAYRLGIFRDSPAAPALVRALDDESREVRVAAAMSLASCGTRESVPGLVETLRDVDPWTAQAAAIALENLTGHRESSNPFGTRRERVSLARQWQTWLEQSGWDRIEQQLVSTLDHGERDVARRAAVALGHIGGDSARAALRRYVDRHRQDNPFPAWRKEGHVGDAARFDAESAVNPRTLQAAVRALGYLRDPTSIPLLETILEENRDPDHANLFLAEAAAEALGRIGTPQGDDVLIRIFTSLRPYPDYTRWYGDHEALMSCHVSPLHYFIVESLDARGTEKLAALVPHLIRSLPIDPDRALMLELDDYEALVGRIIRRSGAERVVVETCLALLGDRSAKSSPPIQQAVAKTIRCWAGAPTDSIRAAQILSIVAHSPEYEPRIRAAFIRFSKKREEINRVFQTGIPIVDRLPEKNWICFYLARSLGMLGQARSLPALLQSLQSGATEASFGRPDPLGVGILFLHNGLTPCPRAAAAHAVGRLGDSSATSLLLEVIKDLDNAPDVRFAAAQALKNVATADQCALIRSVAVDYPEWSIRRELLSIIADRAN